jgi:predicted membrane GTPase involved in stress response
MLVTTLDWSEFVGRIAIGRISVGQIKQGAEIALIKTRE